MKDLQLDPEEQEILDAYNRGEFKTIDNFEVEKKRHAQIARDTMHILKNKQINIRVSSGDLSKLKSKAAASGLPYQTLISILLHKYVEDDIQITI